MDNTKLRDEAIRIVFKYMNGKELLNASMVCKSWRDIGRKERKSRGPMDYARIISKSDSNKDFYSVNKNIIECCYTKPSLYMTFSNYNSNEEFASRCHCHLLPPGCYSIALKNNYLKDEENTLFCLTFPEVSSIQAFTFTFRSHSLEEKLYCCELIQNIHKSFINEIHLKDKLEAFFVTNRASTCCMIIFSNNIGFYKLIEEVFALSNWFPSSMVPIWGGVVDVLSVCNSFVRKRECNLHADIVNIIISGQDMEMWRLSLNYYKYRSKRLLKEKLIEFKQDVNLKTHSIGFIYTPVPRKTKYCKSQSEVFKKIFPDVKLFHIYGPGVFEGNGFQELANNFPKSVPVEPGSSTSVMILTYN